MRFDSTTSSFLNLLVTKPYKKKTESTKFQRKVSIFRSKKMFKKRFLSGFLSCNPSERLDKLRWPVMIVKLRKGQT